MKRDSPFLRSQLVTLRTCTSLSIFIQCETLHPRWGFIYVTYLGDSFSLWFWKTSVIRFRGPLSFLTAVEWGSVLSPWWDGLSCQDKLSSGNNVRAAPAAVPKGTPCTWYPPTSAPFRWFQTAGWLFSSATLLLGDYSLAPNLSHLHLSWIFGRIFGQDKPAPYQQIPAMGQEPFPKSSLDVATPFWRPKELHSIEILAGILLMLLVPMHPARPVLIFSWLSVIIEDRYRPAWWFPSVKSSVFAFD